MSSLFESFLSTPEVTEALSDRAVIAAMLRFEAALARAQAHVGLIPQAASQSIIGSCKVELFDVPKLVRESARARCLATPLVNSLREMVGLFNPGAASFVHLGCSSQDLIDTALALTMRDVLQLIEADLAPAIQALLALAAQHADDAMLARSALQPAYVTSFGLICSQWVAPLVRSQQRLQSAATDALSLRLGSATLTLADMQGKSPLVTALMATDLQLKAPVFAGHAQHDEAVALACELGLLVGSLGKVAADIAHMTQFEVGELTQPAVPTASVPGAKSVPLVPIATLCMVAQAAAQRAPQQVAVLLATLPQENGNALGNWQTQLVQWPALLAASQGITHAVAQLLEGVHANTERMRANLEAVSTGLNAKEAGVRFSAELVQQASALARTQVQALMALQASTPQD